MEKIDVQVVREKEEKHLFSYRPVFEKAKTCYIQIMLDRCNDIIEDQDLKKIALNNSIPHQVDPKTFPEKREAFAIRRYPLPGDDERDPGEEDDGGYGY
jgi:hypothetical protein